MKPALSIGPEEDERLISRFAAALKTSKKGITPRAVALFREVIYSHYRRHRRAFPWRATRNPYRILVSEVMLQQTQTERVREKYREFIAAFPSFAALAAASLAEVLRVWQGMGYNRRAVALRELAKVVVQRHRGKLPAAPEQLLALPGIGPYTASAIGAFAFNRPGVFIETNIRTVFIHFFFHDKGGVSDKEILPLVEKTLDSAEPRQWYSALMDYGVMLKKTRPNPGRRSAHHKRQSPFKGSNRQLRGAVLRALLSRPGLSEKALASLLGAEPGALKRSLGELLSEGFVRRQGGRLSIAEGP